MVANGRRRSLTSLGPGLCRGGWEARVLAAWVGVVAVLLCWAPVAWAQTGAQEVLLQSITTGGTDCTVATNCVVSPDIFRTSQVSIQLAGSWSGTVQFEGSIDGTNWTALVLTPIASGTAVSSATGNGIWSGQAAVAKVRARCSTFNSGPISVSILAR